MKKIEVEESRRIGKEGRNLNKTKQGTGLTADPRARSEMASASLRVSCWTPFMSFSSGSDTE